MSEDERYRRSVPDRRHAYEDFPTTEHLLSRVVDGPSEQEFVDEVVDILHGRDYWDATEHRRKKAAYRARQIYEKLGDDPGSLTTGEREVVSEALDKGVLRDLRLDEAWHPHNFLSDDEATTYPYQHPTTVIYTGQNKRLFFSKPGKTDIKKYKQEERHGEYREFTNPESIFDQGYIAKSDTDKTTSINDAVFFTFDYMHAADRRYGGSSFPGLYESSVVFEVEVPSRWITICKNPTGSAKRFRGMDELHEEYGSPEEFRRKVVKGDEKSQEKVQFELEKSGLPVNMITGVWDLERNDEPDFYTLEEYHRVILSDFPFRVSWKCRNVSWSIDTSEVDKLRREKLEEEEVEKGLKLMNDFSRYAQEVLELLGFPGEGAIDSCRRKDLAWVDTGVRQAPMGCSTCGNVYTEDQEYCPVCGSQKSEGFFRPVQQLKQLEEQLKSMEKLVKPAHEWEKEARKRIGDGEKVDSSEISIPWKVLSKIAERFVRYNYRLSDYSSCIVEASDSNGKRVSKLRQDLERCQKDLEKISD